MKFRVKTVSEVHTRQTQDEIKETIVKALERVGHNIDVEDVDLEVMLYGED